LSAFSFLISVPMPDSPILLIQCPSCQHENTPGEHFCAKCGVPLHLKPCAHCGKVDEAAASVCQACGTPFPLLSADQYVPAEAVRPIPPMTIAVHDDESAIHTDRLAPANRAWPLIIVALAAGGIPFLWMYRANMPLPRAWQVKGENAAGNALAPPVSVPPPAAVVPPVPVPVPAAVPPAQTTMPQGASQVAASASPAKTLPPVAKPPAKAVLRRPAEQTLPCTEALAAIDLCGPQPAK
jgi:hypothetical protein